MYINENIQSIKEELYKNKVHITSFDEVDFFLLKVPHNRLLIEFDNNIIKSYFINQVKEYVINCNSSYNRFYEEMENCFSSDTIFNYSGVCNDMDILSIIKNTNNIMIL